MNLKDSISHLVVIGANHRSSSLKFRERITLSGSELRILLKKIELSGIKNHLLISEDDRIEFICLHHSPKYIFNFISSSLVEITGLSTKEVVKNLFILEKKKALHHIFYLTSTIDNLIPGDFQFFLSIKNTFLKAKKLHSFDSSLGKIIERAIITTDVIQKKTKLFEIPMSIVRAAEQIAKEIHGDLSGCISLFIGPGKMAEMLVRHFQDLNLGKIIVTSASARWMEKISISSANKKIPFDNLEQALAKVDILITGAGNERIITEEIIKSALSGRKAKPLFIIDGSVPGDVEAGVSRLEDVFLYDLNDLEQIVIDNRFENNIAIGEAKRLIEEEISLILTDIDKNNSLSKDQEQFDDLDLEKSKRDVLRRAKVNAKPVAIINDFIKELKKRNLIKKERNN